MPIVAGMGGNAATQTLTVIVRGLALGELAWGNARKVVIKEAAIGLGSGLTLGVVAALLAWAAKGEEMIGLLLGMAMVCNMLVATIAGTIIPLGLKALKVDPALASSVFITTLTDMVGFASFLGFATIFLKYLPL
jgi:magnesium transporter